jgi:hypothetical protein
MAGRVQRQTTGGFRAPPLAAPANAADEHLSGRDAGMPGRPRSGPGGDRRQIGFINKKGAEMSNSAFVQARDFLQAHRTDYETAYRDFKWPVLDDFNWALDYFDVMAAGNDRPALWVVNEDGSEQKMSFAEMSRRSNQGNSSKTPGISVH